MGSIRRMLGATWPVCLPKFSSGGLAGKWVGGSLEKLRKLFFSGSVPRSNSCSRRN